MNANMTPGDYLERLSNGETVYVIDVQHKNDSLVKKGTVTQLDGKRRYPLILIWPNVYKDPKGSGLHIAKSPREVFTHDEVWAALYEDDTLNHLVQPYLKDVEEIVEDQVFNRAILTPILGRLIISRMADDWLRNPLDPEY